MARDCLDEHLAEPMKGYFPCEGKPENCDALVQHRDEIARLQTALARAHAALRRHHDRELGLGELGLPDGDGGFVAVDMADAYADSALCDQTIAALEDAAQPEETDHE